MGADSKLRRRMGCTVPQGPGIFEVVWMGRRMKVHVNKDSTGELKVFGVPGHPNDGLPLTDFDGYVPPRIDDPRRSYTANLSKYDRAMSRFIAGLTALRAALDEMPADEQDKRSEAWNGSQFDACDLDSEIALSYEAVDDKPGVEKAVKERLGVWYIEDRDGIPLPSYGPGAPPEGKDVNGRDQ